MKTSLFVASAVTSLLVLSLLFDLSTAPIVLGVIFIHELGHILGMAAFGYRNRQVLFLPFLGAAAVGEKPEANAWQQLGVLLLGPLPGILVGLVCLGSMDDPVSRGLFDASPWLQFTLISVILNYINLLPFGMLDGGRIVQLLFLRRFPRIQFVFFVTSAAVFLGVAVWTNDPILWVLGLLSALGLPAQLKIALARGALGREIKVVDAALEAGDATTAAIERQEKLAVFEQLAQPAFAKALPMVKHRLAQQLLSYVTAPRLRW